MSLSVNRTSPEVLQESLGYRTPLVCRACRQFRNKLGITGLLWPGRTSVATLFPPQVPEPTEARAKRAREKPVQSSLTALCMEHALAKPKFRSCTAGWRSKQKRTIRPRSCSLIRSAYVSTSLRHRNCGKTRRTNRSNLRRDAERTEPPIKPLAQKTLGIKKHVDMETATSSSDLTCGQGLRICTPRAGAFESLVVLGV